VASLSWTAWPAGRSPLRAAIAAGFLVLLGWTLESMFHAPYFTVLGVLLVWGQIAGFFLPTRYVLTDEGVSVAGLVARKHKAWSDFRSVHADREGVLLSPFPARSRLERFRGLSLQFHDNRDEVMAFVERCVGRPGGADEHVGAERQGEDGGAEGRA